VREATKEEEQLTIQLRHQLGPLVFLELDCALQILDLAFKRLDVLDAVQSRERRDRDPVERRLERL
jgi:hypothetical protein